MDEARLRDFGAVCFGPVMFQFVRWLARQAAARDVDALWFLAREGHFLMAAYEKYFALGLGKNTRKLPSKYMLTSRRALFGAARKSRASLRSMLEAGMFVGGSMRALVRTRFGDGAADLVREDRTVSLPRDTDLVLDALMSIVDGLNDAAAEERAALVKHLDEIGFTRSAHAGLVDLGYSGSIQRHLHDITGAPMTGFYFATSEKVRSWITEKNRAMACFGEEKKPTDPVAVYRNSLLLEAWLTSPDPQLLRFDANGKPIFGERGAMQERFAQLQTIDAGVHDYFEEVARLGGGDDDVSWFSQEVMLAVLFGDQWADVVGLLSVEDRFCGNAEIEIAGRYEEA